MEPIYSRFLSPPMFQKIKRRKPEQNWKWIITFIDLEIYLLGEESFYDYYLKKNLQEIFYKRFQNQSAKKEINF